MPAILDSLFHKVVNTTSSPIGVGVGGGGEPQSGGTFQYKNFLMAKWLQFRLFSAPHATKCSYIDAQSHQPVLNDTCQLSAWPGKLEPFTDHLSTLDARQAREWGLSKSRPLKFWQWYKHERLVYCCTCRMAMKSETWNCACIRSLLANLVTYCYKYTVMSKGNQVNRDSSLRMHSYAYKLLTKRVWPKAWFLKIVFVNASVCVCMCVWVSACQLPRELITSSVTWCDIDCVWLVKPVLQLFKILPSINWKGVALVTQRVVHTKQRCQSWHHTSHKRWHINY